MDSVFEKLAQLENRLNAIAAKCKELKARKAHLEAQIARLQSEAARLTDENGRLRAMLSERMLGGEWVGNGQMKAHARKQLDEMIDTINRIIESVKTDVGKG